MPLYEFECKCGNKETLQLPMDKRHSIPDCPICGEYMKRVVSNVSLGGMDEYGRSKSK